MHVPFLVCIRGVFFPAKGRLHVLHERFELECGDFAYGVRVKFGPRIDELLQTIRIEVLECLVYCHKIPVEDNGNKQVQEDQVNKDQESKEKSITELPVTTSYGLIPVCFVVGERGIIRAFVCL